MAKQDASAKNNALNQFNGNEISRFVKRELRNDLMR